MRVLMVEDEPRLAENVARSLRESAGYAVDIAADGQEGLFLVECLRRGSAGPHAAQAGWHGIAAAHP
jgi:DNA-binding response OmpR family regulator